MFKPLYMAVLAAITSSLLTSTLFHALTQPPRIATVDVGRVTMLFVDKEAKKHHSEEQKKKAIKAFSASLEKSLQQIADKNALVLLPKEAVFKGSLDYTEALIAMLALEKAP